MRMAMSCTSTPPAARAAQKWIINCLSTRATCMSAGARYLILIVVPSAPAPPELDGTARGLAARVASPLTPILLSGGRLCRDEGHPTVGCHRPDLVEPAPLEPMMNLDMIVRECVLRRIQIEGVAHAPSMSRWTHAHGKQQPRDERPDNGDLRDVIEGYRDVAQLEQQTLRQPCREFSVELCHGQIRLVVARIDECHQLSARLHQRRQALERARGIRSVVEDAPAVDEVEQLAPEGQ